MSPHTLLSWALEAEHLVDQHDGDAPRGDLAVDDKNLVDRAAYGICRLSAGVFERVGVLLDAVQTLLEVRHDLLGPHDENDSSSPADIWPELAAAHRSREQRSRLGHRVDAPE